MHNQTTGMKLNLLNGTFTTSLERRWETILEVLKNHTDPLLKHNLCIRAAKEKERDPAIQKLIPVKPSDYQNADVIVSQIPQNFENAVTITDLEVGYEKDGKLIPVTRLNFITFDPTSGRVHEVGVGSNKAGYIFLDQIFPKPRNQETKKRLPKVGDC